MIIIFKTTNKKLIKEEDIIIAGYGNDIIIEINDNFIKHLGKYLSYKDNEIKLVSQKDNTCLYIKKKDLFYNAVNDNSIILNIDNCTDFIIKENIKDDLMLTSSDGDRIINCNIHLYEIKNMYMAYIDTIKSIEFSINTKYNIKMNIIQVDNYYMLKYNDKYLSFEKTIQFKDNKIKDNNCILKKLDFTFIITNKFNNLYAGLTDKYNYSRLIETNDKCFAIQFLIF